MRLFHCSIPSRPQLQPSSLPKSVRLLKLTLNPSVIQHPNDYFDYYSDTGANWVDRPHPHHRGALHSKLFTG